MRYCSYKVSKLIQVLSGYPTSWSTLKDQILKIFDADKDKTRYKVKDLHTFVKGQKLKPIKTLSAWKKFQRKFTTIANWLLSEGKITKNEHATYLWQAIHQQFQAKVESRLLAAEPSKDLTKPFDTDKILEAAERQLAQNWFDSDLVYSGSDSSEDSDGTDSDTESDSAQTLTWTLIQIQKGAGRRISEEKGVKVRPGYLGATQNFATNQKGAEQNFIRSPRVMGQVANSNSSTTQQAPTGLLTSANEIRGPRDNDDAVYVEPASSDEEGVMVYLAERMMSRVTKQWMDGIYLPLWIKPATEAAKDERNQYRLIKKNQGDSSNMPGTRPGHTNVEGEVQKTEA
ncbi:hypothetical protein HYDPIDRAFT_170959 [Hydnomerulius pinastri MD-312]|uniref:Uncharacterized protein n=1 Tax=Hydnomerulius pinastri MD-312 TaxID=994086 RepID=A0A0C9W816_9AGAM|nr:hypothetical protein HYDPIDRAFT_170959 [Hydnomerulius pinastri MD-312]